VRAFSKFPAVGDTQCFVGKVNGEWRTWMVHGDVTGKIHYHSDRNSAFQAHDDNIEVLKYKMNGMRQMRA